MFFRKKKEVKSAAAVGLPGGDLSTELLRDMTTQFAIGEQILLHPEYIQALELKSIVVGLLVNQRMIYANEEVVWDEESQTLAFYCRDEDKHFSQVKEFALLLPLESNDERKMSYQSKEELSRVGLFKRGNTITVTATGGGRRSYAIDALVTSYLRLQQGLFANHEVAVLNLDPATLKVSERRKYQRLITDVPASMKALKGERVFECRLIDFVEEGARFVMPEAVPASIFVSGKSVAVAINLVEMERRYRLEGAVLKVEGCELVVKFRNIFKDGAVTPFSNLDGIEMKAMLQKLPQSRIA